MVTVPLWLSTYPCLRIYDTSTTVRHATSIQCWVNRIYGSRKYSFYVHRAISRSRSLARTSNWHTGNLINFFRNRIVRQSCRKSNRLSIIIIILYENENKKKMLHKHRYIYIVVNSDEELDFVKNCYCWEFWILKAEIMV